MGRITKIAGREAPVVAGDLITLRFSAGRGGKEEAGSWEFWTVLNDRGGCTARCLPGSDPGQRFTEWKVCPTMRGCNLLSGRTMSVVQTAQGFQFL